MKKVTVIGAGTMGNGIAHVFAMKGYDVFLCDISASALEKAIETITRNLDRMLKKEKISSEDKDDTLKHIKTTNNLEFAVGDADLIVEAATENVELKLNIFRDIDKYAPERAGLIDEWTFLRGITQTYLDMSDNPELLHAGMRRLMEGKLAWLEYLEQQGVL